MGEISLSALGIVNALGSSKSEVFANMIAGDLKHITKSDKFIEDKDVMLGLVHDELPEIPNDFKEYDFRCNRMLLASYFQIESEVQDVIKKYGKDRVAVIIGAGTSGVDEVGQYVSYYQMNQKHVSEFSENAFEMGAPAKFLSKYLGLTGIFYSVSTACSSSAKAFLSAQNLIDLDLCDAVLVGGSDSLCKLTVGGFNSLEAVSAEICNPMSKNRDGITLGEGSALFLLTKGSGIINLLGVGESSDAHHITSPDPTGAGAIEAINDALNNSSLKPCDIDYINLHGTATELNDKMESLAVNTIFGEKAYCSSTKPMTGHTLGAAGVTEVALCWLALFNFNESKLLPSHIWDGDFDPKLEKLGLVEKSGKVNLKKLSICMSNSFAFGGSNAVVIIGNRENV